MKLFAISMVRDEVDIVRTTVLHSLAQGIDRFYIVDNGSSDGTTEALEDLGRDKRVRWTRDEGPFRASETLTHMAREAWREGADWVLEIDADEFWIARLGKLKRAIERSRAARLRVDLVNFVQKREQAEPSLDGLLHMTWRAPVPQGPEKQRVTDKEIAYVEAIYPQKFICRTSREMALGAGSHSVEGVAGEEVATRDIVCLHAPLRARSVLDLKAARGARVEEAGFEGDESWHLRRWRQLRDDGLLDAEWAANSYLEGALDVYGTRRPLVFDATLANLARPWLAPAPRRRFFLR